MNKKVLDIIDKLKEKYSDIDTILLFGSASTASWTPESDIDIFLIDPKFTDSREDLIIDGVTIEIQKDNFDNLAKDMEFERGSLLNRNLSTMIASSDIISSKSLSKMENLKTLANSVLDSKVLFSDEDTKMWRYSIEDYLSKADKDLKQNDLIAFYMDTHYVMQNALELSLATHGAYMPQPKNLAKVLQKTDPSVYQIFKDFTSSIGPQEKLEILQKLLTL